MSLIQKALAAGLTPTYKFHNRILTLHCYKYPNWDGAGDEWVYAVEYRDNHKEPRLFAYGLSMEAAIEAIWDKIHLYEKHMV